MNEITYPDIEQRQELAFIIVEALRDQIYEM